MTTVAASQSLVTGGVDTHLDTHVAAALDRLGGVLGTAQFPTTAADYRRLLRWLRGFGEVGRVGVEGTGSYGAALARHMTGHGITVIEVSRPDRQVRRRHGKTDVVDAIAAARAAMSGEAAATPKTHDGSVEGLRMLKVLQCSANKSRTQALNQLRSLLVTAPPELRAKLQHLPRRDLLATSAAFRVTPDGDSLPGLTRFALRDLAERIQSLDERLKEVNTRLRRITTAAAPDLVELHGVGPDTASTLLITAGDNPERLTSERSFAALTGCCPIPARAARPTATASTAEATGKPTPPSGASPSSAWPATNAARPTSPSETAKAKARPKRSAASSATSPAKSSTRYRSPAAA